MSISYERRRQLETQRLRGLKEMSDYCDRMALRQILWAVLFITFVIGLVAWVTQAGAQSRTTSPRPKAAVVVRPGPPIQQPPAPRDIPPPAPTPAPVARDRPPHSSAGHK